MTFKLYTLQSVKLNEKIIIAYDKQTGKAYSTGFLTNNKHYTKIPQRIRNGYVKAITDDNQIKSSKKVNRKMKDRGIYEIYHFDPQSDEIQKLDNHWAQPIIPEIINFLGVGLDQTGKIDVALHSHTPTITSMLAELEPINHSVTPNSTHVTLDEERQPSNPGIFEDLNLNNYLKERIELAKKQFFDSLFRAALSKQTLHLTAPNEDVTVIKVRHSLYNNAKLTVTESLECIKEISNETRSNEVILKELEQEIPNHYQNNTLPYSHVIDDLITDTSSFNNEQFYGNHVNNSKMLRVDGPVPPTDLQDLTFQTDVRQLHNWIRSNSESHISEDEDFKLQSENKSPYKGF